MIIRGHLSFSVASGFVGCIYIGVGLCTSSQDTFEEETSRRNDLTFCSSHL